MVGWSGLQRREGLRRRIGHDLKQVRFALSEILAPLRLQSSGQSLFHLYNKHHGGIFGTEIDWAEGNAEEEETGGVRT